ncbi:MAG TPA: hypothetical protein VFI20_02505 [Terracidiphilus sp.]|nr:hypothetical protein [Terracidiphilus sp.]
MPNGKGKRGHTQTAGEERMAHIVEREAANQRQHARKREHETPERAGGGSEGATMGHKARDAGVWSLTG